MIRPSQRHFANENLDPRLRAGLIGHWIGGGSGLTWFDRSGNNNHGALTNGPLWTLGREGRRAALSFDGSNDTVDVPSSAKTQPVSLTIAAWTRLRSLTNYGIIAGDNTDFGGYRYGWALEAGRGSAGAFYPYFFIGSGVYNPVASSITVAAQEWFHVAGTFEDATKAMRIYVNGVLAGSATAGGSISYAGSLISIGALKIPAFWWGFPGELDDVRLYNRPLSAAETGLLAQPSFLPVVPRRWFVGYVPDTTITTDATAASATWVAPAATARLRLTTQATAAVSAWFAPSATARTRYTVPASAALSTWVAPSASAQLARRRSIPISGSRSSYSIAGSRASYHIEGS